MLAVLMVPNRTMVETVKLGYYHIGDPNYFKVRIFMLRGRNKAYRIGSVGRSIGRSVCR